MEKYKLKEYIEVLKNNNQLVEFIDCEKILDKYI